jgi:phosphatidylglycerol---prolipoprotein diacylglyceryl transferase
MVPVLINLPFIKIYTFGVFLAFALLWALFIFWKQARLTSYKEEDLFDCAFVALAGGAIVSRLFYVAAHFSSFGFDILKIILINGYPGASLIGFFIGFYIVLALMLFKKGIPIIHAFDYSVTPLFVALTIGKIGSFFAGVDVGTTTHFLLHVKYVGYAGFRHITALYESIFFLIGAIISARLLFATRRETFAQMTPFFFFLFYFGLITLALDKLKVNHLYFAHLNVNLVIASVSCIIGSLFFIITYRQNIIQYGKQIITKRNRIIEGGIASKKD